MRMHALDVILSDDKLFKSKDDDTTDTVMKVSSISNMPAIITDIASSPKPTRPPSDLKSATPAIVIGMAAAFGGFLYG
ncbi:hypothetical protein OC845_006715, partial [Tilletia horrida]